MVVAGLLSASARAQVTSWLYRIHGGSYVVIGGFAGAWTNQLPTPQQEYIDLELDHAGGTARLRILDRWAEAEFLRLDHGLIVGSQVIFSNEMLHPYYPSVTNRMAARYTLELGDASIWLNGSISGQVPCCDIPNLFLHQDVQATVVSGPPPNPIGLYCYQGYDGTGSLVVTGWLAIATRDNPIAGSWWLERTANAGEIGPQTGRGRLTGWLDGNGLSLDLNPGQADNNVLLSGTLADGVYRGGWAYGTFPGTAAQGTFVAEQRLVRILGLRLGPSGLVLAHQVPEGLVGVLECTDSPGLEDWRDVIQFKGAGGTAEIQLGEPSQSGRFYRLRIADLTVEEDHLQELPQGVPPARPAR